MKKYRIWEHLMNEYTEFPASAMIGEVEASSPEEAYTLAKQLYPHATVERVDDRETSYVMKHGIIISSGMNNDDRAPEVRR